MSASPLILPDEVNSYCDSNLRESRTMSPSLDGEPSASAISLIDTSSSEAGEKDSCHLKISRLQALASESHDEDSGSHELSSLAYDQHSRLHESDDLPTAAASSHDPSLESVADEDSKISSEVSSTVLGVTTDDFPEGITLHQCKAMARKQRRAIRKAEALIRRKESDKLKREQRKLQKKMMSGEKRQSQDLAVPKAKKKRMCEGANVRVAIDLSYDDLMNDKDTIKVMGQCLRCYSSNRRAEVPLQLYLTSFSERTRTAWDKQYTTYTRWDVHRHEESFVELFGRSDVIFLTSESPNIISALGDDKVYIIGGLVDHNHHKGYCYQKALELGVAHAQLPISQYIKLNSRTVLAINHVFEILLEFSMHKDWEKALRKVIPPRKMCTLQGSESASPSITDEMSVANLAADSALNQNDYPTTGQIELDKK